MNSLKAVSINLFIPILISFVFGLVIYNEAKLPAFLFAMVPYLFYALSAMVIWVSWHFNRNRFIFVVLPLVLMHFGFEYLSLVKSNILFLYVSTFYSIHLLFFLLIKERGLFSIWGVINISFFVIEIATIAYLIYSPNTDIYTFFDLKIFAVSLHPLKDVTVVMAIVVSFIMVGLILFGKYILYSTTFFVILIAYYLGFYFIKTPHAVEISFLAITVIIFTLLIRESYRLAFYDELTSMPGRRALVEDMAKLGRKYTLAMIDIDHFKKFNDTYGHDTGDEVLKMVASKLMAVSGGGKAYRYGGEEFTILFPSKDVNESFVYVDVLRETIATTPFFVRNKKSTKKIFINISSGIVEYKSKDKDPFAVMKRADNALYKAKEAGRNKVIKA